MGKEIVYCDLCGARIAGDEFDRGRAVTVESKNYCAGCRKQAPAAAPATPPKAAAKPDMTISSRIMVGSKIIRASTQTPPSGHKRPPVPRGHASGRVPRPTVAPPRPDKNKKLILAAAAVGVVALVGGFVAMSLSKDKGSDRNTGSSGDGALSSPDAPLWVELQTFDQQNAADPVAVLERFREKRPRCADPEIRAKIDARIADLEKLAASQAADTALDRLIKDVGALDPTKEMREIDSAFKMAAEKAKENPAYAPKIEQLRAGLQNKLRTTLPAYLSGALQKADQFKNEKKYIDALYEIDGALSTLKAASPYVPFETQRADLERKKEELKKLVQ